MIDFHTFLTSCWRGEYFSIIAMLRHFTIRCRVFAFRFLVSACFASISSLRFFSSSWDSGIFLKIECYISGVNYIIVVYCRLFKFALSLRWGGSVLDLLMMSHNNKNYINGGLLCFTHPYLSLFYIPICSVCLFLLFFYILQKLPVYLYLSNLSISLISLSLFFFYILQKIPICSVCLFISNILQKLPGYLYLFFSFTYYKNYSNFFIYYRNYLYLFLFFFFFYILQELPVYL